MKKIPLFMALLPLMMGCSPKTSTTSVPDTADEWITLSDTPEEKFQPNRLFYGVDNADSLLVDSLSPEGKVRSAINCFLTRQEGRYLLFDAGLGTAQGGQLFRRLEEHGLTPDSISEVFITHCHPDHIGGLMDTSHPAFPQAKVYIPKAETEFWTDKLPLMPLIKEAYAENLIEFDEQTELPDGIKAFLTGGHTPGHTVFQLGNVLIAGDLMHGMDLQIPHPEICASYDMDREKSVEVRKYWLDYAKQNGLTVYGAHLYQPVE